MGTDEASRKWNEGFVEKFITHNDSQEPGAAQKGKPATEMMQWEVGRILGGLRRGTQCNMWGIR